MGKLLRRLIPLAAILAWRNREQLAQWYRKRNESGDDTPSPTQTQIAPIPGNAATVDSTLEESIH